MTPLREIVKALKEISEWPWIQSPDNAGAVAINDAKNELRILVYPKPSIEGNDATNINFVASSPRLLAEMVVKVVEEGAVLCARKQEPSWLWDEWSGPARKQFIGQVLRDEGITPEDFAWLKGKVGG